MVKSEELERRIVALEKEVKEFTSPVVKCKYCEGKGFVTYRDKFERSVPIKCEGVCPVCKGRGKVRV